MTGRLRLTRKQRAQLFAGDCPAIHGQNPCPVKPGDEVRLSALVAVCVVRVDAKKGGGWKLHYAVIDRRDPRRLLRRTPPVVTPEADQNLPNEDEAARAARESSYTSAHAGTVPDAGEAVDEVTQRRITQEAHRHAGHQSLVNEARRERHELEQRLERVRADARLRDVDISSPLRVIERQLKRIEKRVYDGEAA